MDTLLREFLTESHENLIRLEHEVLELERAPTNTDLLNSVFRIVHTVKGTCGFLQLRRLERVAHACENVLALVRDGRLDASRSVMTTVLEAIDVIRNIVAALEHDGTEPPGDDDSLVAKLEAWAVSDLLQEASAPEGFTADALIASARTPETNPARASDATVRVHVHVLERLDTLARDLTLAGEELTQLATSVGSPLVAHVEQLTRIAAELDATVARARLRPVSDAWRRLPRVVRDLAQETGKCIELDLLGGETEVDPEVLHAIQDPLMHLVRNCADHGIEAPEARVLAGKPACGCITLSARQADGKVVIDVTDDGAGLDASRIRQKAIERRLLSREAAAAMSDDETLRLIFQPGFSTADRVTNVSGRGVGMDVVYTNITLIGGTVELSTQVRVGTTVRVRIPTRTAEPLQQPQREALLDASL
jgi:two-component system chemotaxis sensor kinase CheA